MENKDGDFKSEGDGLAGLSADVIEVLLDEAEDEGIFAQVLELNRGNQEILKLLCGHPDTPPEVRAAAAKAASLPEKPPPPQKRPADQDEKQERISLKVQRLKTGEKIRLSMMAGREARSLLIRDANKQVVLGVIGNPKMTVSEVEMAARMRSLPEEGLREISKNKEWMKNYGIVHNLVTNSKTPAGVAVGLLPRLRQKDLEFIQLNKEVSEAVRIAAKRLSSGRAKNR